MHPYPLPLLMRSALLLFIALLASCASNGQSLSERRAVYTVMVADNGSGQLSLAWPMDLSATGYAVFRRMPGVVNWGSAIANLPGSATGFTDATVQPGAAYEYRVTRSAASGAANGYVRGGLGRNAVEYRGVVLVVVEQVLHDALGNALLQLEDDLLGDGWFTERIVVPATATPGTVRGLIQAAHANDPTRVKAVYLLGNVPVPYTGDIAPDGHDHHRGAWACDGYYGELDGTWTDVSVNSVGSNWTWNRNVPGDGKFDQSSFPSALELQVGRVDLSRLSVFPESEAELTQAYLAKARAFKTGVLRVPERAVIWDDLQWTNYPLAVSAHMSFAPCVGIDSVRVLPVQGTFAQHLLANNDLLTFHAAAGLQGDANAPFPGTLNGVSVDQLPGLQKGGVFNMAVGSYFGDWDNPNNYLRALLARGNALVHVWSGLPNWFLHPLGSGETVGYCALRTHNNTNNDFTLANGGWQGQNYGRVHLGLMGDPTLRLRYVAPPTDLVATNTQWYATFSWQPSPDAVDGYLIYRIDAQARTLERITPEPVQGTSYTAALPFEPGVRYMVRAVRLQHTASGSYHDLSLGALAVSEGLQLPDCAGVVGGTAWPGTPCDADDPALLYDADCQCGGSTIGMAEHADEALQLWPTPTGAYLHVRVDAPQGWLIVRSLAGAELLRQNVTQRDVVLDTAPWATGTFVVEWQPVDGVRAALRRMAVVSR